MIPITLPAPLITRGVSVVPICGMELHHQRAEKENSHLQINGQHNTIFSSCIVEKVLDYNPQHHHCLLKSCQVSLKGFDGITRRSKINFCQDED